MVERVAIGRVVDEVPPVRQVGDVTILPVVEEEIVVTRQARSPARRSTSAAFRPPNAMSETVTLREQQRLGYPHAVG